MAGQINELAGEKNFGLPNEKYDRPKFSSLFLNTCCLITFWLNLFLQSSFFIRLDVLVLLKFGKKALNGDKKDRPLSQVIVRNSDKNELLTRC